MHFTFKRCFYLQNEVIAFCILLITIFAQLRCSLIRTFAKLNLSDVAVVFYRPLISVFCNKSISKLKIFSDADISQIYFDTEAFAQFTFKRL